MRRPLSLGRCTHRRHRRSKGASRWAMPSADLAVTGRVSYGRFKATPPNEASLVAAVRAGPGSPGQAVPGDVANAVSMALDRAYAVAWALRGPIAPQPAARTPLAWAAARKSSLNWIAVSGEDDTPHRPVNVAPPEFQQFEIPVPVPGRRLSRMASFAFYRDRADAFLHRISGRGSHARHLSPDSRAPAQSRTTHPRRPPGDPVPSRTQLERGRGGPHYPAHPPGRPRPRDEVLDRLIRPAEQRVFGDV